MLNQNQGMVNPAVSTPGAMMNMRQAREDSVLFIGNLSKDANDQTLYEFFSPIGNLMSVSVKKNFYTGEPRGFGFANFNDPESAKKAKEQLNHTSLLGREIRISFKKDFNKLDPDANLYINNLDEKVTGKIVENEFSKFGPIFCCAVRYDENNKHLEDAETAMTDLDGIDYEGKPISVMKFLPKAKRGTTGWRTNLYVKGFPSQWSRDQVEKFIDEKFVEFGKVSSKCIKFSEKFGTHFAFVAFEQADEATEAVKSLQDHEVDDTTLYVGYAQKKYARKKALQEQFAKAANETNLFVKSLKEDVTEEVLRNVFGKYGEVTSIGLKEATKIPKLLQDKGIKLKFGFINFNNSDEAKNALSAGKKDPEVTELIHPEHDFRKDFLYFAQPKMVRQQYLRMQRKNMQTTMMLQQQMMMMQMMMAQNFQTQRKMQKMMTQPNNMGNMGNMGMKMNPMMMNPMMMMQQQQQMAAMNQMNMQQQMMQMQQNQHIENQEVHQNPQIETTQVQPPQPQPIAEEAKDIMWLKNNQREFEQLSGDEKRKILGNLMYYRVANLENVQKELVPKITGMLIDLEVLELSDIVEILHIDDVLVERVNDAISIINEAE